MRNPELAVRLEAYRRQRAMTESQLAADLGSSQPTVHRFLNHKGGCRPGFAEDVKRLLGVGGAGDDLEEWLSAVASAARSSPGFRALVDAGLSLLNESE